MKLGKLDPADKAFSIFIRKRDGKCVRCKRRGSGDEGIFGLQCSHYFGRSREGTRYDPDNADAICFACHQYWGSTDYESYREFKTRQLGEKRYKALTIRARLYCRKDRKMALLVVRELAKQHERPMS